MKKNRFKWFSRSFKALALFYFGIFVLLHVVKAMDLPESILGDEPEQRCTMEISIYGGIGPASLDILERAQKRAEKLNCGSLLLIINTPGGNLQSTRLIVENILNSPLPVLCLVAPSGAHAGSAGAIIMQACHVSGALEATNLGAATPVSGGGDQMSDDMRNKIMNDTRSWVEGLAKLRGRNEEFAKDIVESAKAVAAREAFEINAIDWVGARKLDFLTFADGKEVKMSDDEMPIVQTGDITTFEPDLRHQVLSFFTNPQIAYLIFMGSLGLLYFELTNPGLMVPGVVGAVGLIVSLVSLHMLEVTWAGLLLIVLGMALMVAEAFVASFGILGIGGVTAFVIGSIFLFDTEATGYVLPLSTVIPTAIFLFLPTATEALAGITISWRVNPGILPCPPLVAAARSPGRPMAIILPTPAKRNLARTSPCPPIPISTSTISKAGKRPISHPTTTDMTGNRTSLPTAGTCCGVVRSATVLNRTANALWYTILKQVSELK